MAWHLNSDDNTTDFAADPSRFVEVSGRGADKSGLRPGDLLNDTIDGHAFLFEAWESDHVHFSYFNFGGLDGSAPPEHHTHETFSQAKVGFEPTGNYVAYRYVNVVDDPGVSAVYDAAGAYHVFSINKDGTLYQRIHTADGWGAFQNLGGTVHGTPGVTYHDGRYDVFAIGGGGALYQQIYDGTWHGWTKIGGSNLVGGVQALYVNGVYHIFAINNDGTLYQLIHNADGWGDWQNLGSGVSGVPGVTYHDGRYDVFAAGGEGVLYQKTYDGTWHDWNRIGGSNLTNVEACTSMARTTSSRSITTAPFTRSFTTPTAGEAGRTWTGPCTVRPASHITADVTTSSRSAAPEPFTSRRTTAPGTAGAPPLAAATSTDPERVEMTKYSYHRLRRAAALIAVAVLTIAGLVATSPAASAAVGSDLCAQVGYNAGFRDDSLVTAVAVALAESGCDPSAVSPRNSDGSVDRGLWQINSVHIPPYTVDCLLDAQCNAGAAWDISGQGSTWQPWTTYNNGAYRQFLDEARAAVGRLQSTAPGYLPGISAVYDAAGAYHVFAINKDGTLYQRIHTDDGWGAFQNLGGTVHGTPGVTYHDGRYDVFAIGGGGALYQQIYDGSWHGWTKIGGSNLTGGVEALYVNGAYHVFAINNDGTLYQLIHTADGWGDWQNLGGNLKGVPGITYHDNRYDVFAAGSDGVLQQRTAEDGTWSGWHSVSGSNLTGGVNALYIDGNYHIFAINNDGTLYQLIHNTDGWGSWQNLNGVVHGTLGITYHGGRYDVFAVGGTGGIYQQTYDGTWHGWSATVGGSNFLY